MPKRSAKKLVKPRNPANKRGLFFLTERVLFRASCLRGGLARLFKSAKAAVF